MIRVSDIAVYLKCPMMCYFLNKGHNLVNEITPAYLERLILKEMALTYGDAFNALDKLSFLGDSLDRISDEIRIIYRTELSGIDARTLADSVSNVRSYLENICSNISSDDFYTSEIVDEPLLQSEKLGLSGSPDRLVKINGELVPSIIKTGNMPQSGVWSSDRLALTAYSILVEEKYNSSVEKGFVEYARWGKVREVLIKRHERRKVLTIRDRIKKIHEGFMPEKPKDAPCEHCGFTGICDVKSTLVSRFF